MVKLINFFDAPYFNTLRQAMKAELIEEFHFNPGITLLEDDFIQKLSGDGLEIQSLDEIEFRADRTLGYKGQRVLLYIRDISPYGQEVKMPKFHISTCETLIKMWKMKRSERYLLQHKETGIFQVNVMKNNKVEARHERLDVCKNCLNNLNWENYGQNRHLRNQIFSEFSIAEFFKRFPKSLISVKPMYNADNGPLNDYSSNWQKISRNAKAAAKYRCENPTCQVTLTKNNSQYLHVHHIDGQKHNNSKYNLQVLCLKCHADEPLHDHLKALPEYQRYLSIYSSLKK